MRAQSLHTPTLVTCLALAFAPMTAMAEEQTVDGCQNLRDSGNGCTFSCSVLGLKTSSSKCGEKLKHVSTLA